MKNQPPCACHSGEKPSAVGLWDPRRPMYPWREPAHLGPPRYLRVSQDPNWPYRAIKVERIDGGLRTITGKPISRTIGARSRGFLNAGIDQKAVTRRIGKESRGWLNQGIDQKAVTRRIGTPAPGWLDQGIDEKVVSSRAPFRQEILGNRQSGLFDPRPIQETWQQPTWGPTTTAYTRGVHANALPGLSGLGQVTTNTIAGWTCTPHTGEISVRFKSGGMVPFFSLPIQDQTAILAVPELNRGFATVLARCSNAENIRRAKEHWAKQQEITAQNHAKAQADADRIQNKSFLDDVRDSILPGGGGGPSYFWLVPVGLAALVGAALLIRRR